jgi:hypothetical protein
MSMQFVPFVLFYSPQTQRAQTIVFPLALSVRHFFTDQRKKMKNPSVNFVNSVRDNFFVAPVVRYHPFSNLTY